MDFTLFPNLVLATAPIYTARSVRLDGTDYMKRGADLTGVPINSKKGIISFWVDFKGSDATHVLLWSDSSDQTLVNKDASNKVNIEVRNSVNTVIMRAKISTQITSSSGWNHVLCSWDLNTSPVQNIYLNDSDDEDTGASIGIDDVIAYAKTDHGFFVRPATNDFLPDAEVADFYFNMSEYIDITQESNRRKFIDASGKPVDLGTDGSTPTGTAPIVFFSGAVASWHTNNGFGGGFTLTGTLAAGSSSPSD